MRKFFVFHVHHGYFGVYGNSQNEAAQRVSYEIGGYKFTIGLIEHFEFASHEDPEIRTYKNYRKIGRERR